MIMFLLGIAIFVFLFLLIGMFTLAKERLTKSRITLNATTNAVPLRTRNPTAFRALNYGFLILLIVVSFVLANLIRGGASKPEETHPIVAKVPPPVLVSPEAKAEEEERIKQMEARNDLASYLDDAAREKGYHDHIFPGKADELVIVSDMFSDDAGRATFLSVTLPGWKPALCKVGFTRVTLETGVLSIGDTYNVGC